MKDDTECVCVYNTDGCVYKNETHALDLFFAPEKHEEWVNVYRSLILNDTYCSRIYESEEGAKCNARDAIATVKIEWEE